MYMYEPGEVTDALEAPRPGLQAALVISAVGTFFLGVLPGTVLTFTQAAATFTK